MFSLCGQSIHGDQPLSSSKPVGRVAEDDDPDGSVGADGSDGSVGAVGAVGAVDAVDAVGRVAAAAVVSVAAVGRDAVVFWPGAVVSAAAVLRSAEADGSVGFGVLGTRDIDAFVPDGSDAAEVSAGSAGCPQAEQPVSIHAQMNRQSHCTARMARRFLHRSIMFVLISVGVIRSG